MADRLLIKIATPKRPFIFVSFTLKIRLILVYFSFERLMRLTLDILSHRKHTFNGPNDRANVSCECPHQSFPCSCY